MASLFDDIIKEIPGYKVILKSVIKSQIQHLVEQLATTTDEESVILTASVGDGSLSHLGSQSGKDFLRDHDDLKLQFLGFCLKSHYEKKHLERQCQETEVAMHNTYNTNDLGNCETYTATTFVPPQTSDCIYTTTSKISHQRATVSSSSRMRFVPYMKPKAPRRSFNFHQGRNETQVLRQSHETSEIDKCNVRDESSMPNTETHVSEQSEELPISETNDSNKNDNFSGPPAGNNNNIIELTDREDSQEHDYKNDDNEQDSCNNQSKDGSFNHKKEEADSCKAERSIKKNSDPTTNQFCPFKGFFNYPKKEKQDKQDNVKDEESKVTMTKDVTDSVENVRSKSAMFKETKKAPDWHTSALAEVKKENVNEIVDTIKKTVIKSKGIKKESEVLPVRKREEIQTSDLDSSDSYVSRLRSSRSLRRKYEVNNALKMSKARRTSRRPVGRPKAQVRRPRLGSEDKLLSNTSETSTVNTESEYEDINLKPLIKISDITTKSIQCKETDQTSNTDHKTFIKSEADSSPDLPSPDTEQLQPKAQVHSDAGNCDASTQETKINSTKNTEHHEGSLCDLIKEQNLMKQETSSDSESELEIIAVEPGKVLLFQDTFGSNLSKRPGTHGDGKKKSKRGRSPVNKKKEKSDKSERHVPSPTPGCSIKEMMSPAPYVTKLRRFNTDIKDSVNTAIPGFFSDQEPSERSSIPKVKLLNFHPDLKTFDKLSSTTIESTNLVETDTKEKKVFRHECAKNKNSTENSAGADTQKDNDSPKQAELRPLPFHMINREEESPSPASLSNSCSESDDCHDEMASDSSASAIVGRKFETDTEHASRAVSNYKDTNSAELDLQIAHVDPGRSKLLKDKWGNKMFKRKKIYKNSPASERDLRLAKHGKRRRTKKLKGRRKQRLQLKRGIKTDPENYCYPSDSVYSKFQNVPSQQRESQVPPMILTRVSLLTISNDESALSSTSLIPNRHCQVQAFAMAQSTSPETRNPVYAEKQNKKAHFNPCNTERQFHLYEESHNRFPSNNPEVKEKKVSTSNKKLRTVKEKKQECPHSGANCESDEDSAECQLSACRNKTDNDQQELQIPQLTLSRKMSTSSDSSILTQPTITLGEPRTVKTLADIPCDNNTGTENQSNKPFIHNRLMTETCCKEVLSAFEVKAETNHREGSSVSNFPEAESQDNVRLLKSNIIENTNDRRDVSPDRTNKDSVETKSGNELKISQRIENVCKEGHVQIREQTDTKRNSPDHHPTKHFVEDKSLSPSSLTASSSSSSSTSSSAPQLPFSSLSSQSAMKNEPRIVEDLSAEPSKTSENKPTDSAVTNNRQKRVKDAIHAIEESLLSVKTDSGGPGDISKSDCIILTDSDARMSHRGNRVVEGPVLNEPGAVAIQKPKQEKSVTDNTETEVVDVETYFDNIKKPIAGQQANTARFTCTVCGMLFRFKSTLTIHMRSHTGERPFSCETCGKSFTQKAALKRHMLVHGEFFKSFKCRCCITKTKRRKSTRKYTMENRSIRRFLCMFCGRRYLLKSSLESHVQEVHRDEVCVNCHLCKTCTNATETNTLSDKDVDGSNCFTLKDANTACGESSTSSKGLQSDPDTCGSRAVSYCSTCQIKTKGRIENTKVKNGSKGNYEGLNKTYNLNHIVTTNSRECDLCNKLFDSEIELKNHTRVNHYGELFKCTWCRKRFTTERSWKVHVTEYHRDKSSASDDTEAEDRGRYRCDVCGVHFTRNSQLKVHMDIAHSEKRFRCTECRKLFGYKSCLNRHVRLKHAGYHSSQI